MEQDDAKIAESWWSGTAGRGADEVVAPAAAAEDPTDWDSLRQKFVASHAAAPEQQGSRQRRVLRSLVLFLTVVVVLVVAASFLVVAGHPTMSAGIRDTIGALLDEAPSPDVTAPQKEPTPAPRKQSRARRGRAPVAVPVPNAEGRIEAAVREEPPFTIEVIDRNRRTVVHAYDNPLQVAVGARPLVTGTAPEVPSLVIEETIGPGGAISRSTNVGGSVVLSGIVATDGRMRDLQVVRGPAEFVPAAMEAIRRWRFTVLQENGVPVERPARVTVNMAIKADGAASATTK